MSRARSRLLSVVNRARLRLRDRLAKEVTVADDQFVYRFRCEGRMDLWRAETALEKEAGTVRWIKREVRAGDVFYDIGANIGLYAVMAGYRVGEAGNVYAFEPHVVNAGLLLHNVERNQLNGTVKVLSCALNDCEGFFDFNYMNLSAGSSMSQLDDSRDDEGEPFRPRATEWKYGIPADALIDRRIIPPANLVKLDVDGNEVRVLRGMARLLTSPERPRAVQAEVNLRDREELIAVMAEYGYQVSDRHYPKSQNDRIASGADPLSVPHNAIFRPTGD